MIRVAARASALVVAAAIGPILAPGSGLAVAQETDLAGTVLITGSNRGLGFAFAKAYAERGWTVIATARNPAGAEELHALASDHPNLAIEELDVTDFDEIASLAAKLEGVPIDVLINNAGVLGAPESQTLQSLDYETFERVMAVNVFGPLVVSQALLENVAASDQKKIVVVSSVAGSIEFAGGRGGGFYFYSISKAGVNMAMRKLSAQLRGRGILVGIVSPGAADTRMLRRAGYMGPAQSADQAVAGMIARIEELTPENSGTHIQYDGRAIAW